MKILNKNSIGKTFTYKWYLDYLIIKNDKFKLRNRSKSLKIIYYSLLLGGSRPGNICKEIAPTYQLLCLVSYTSKWTQEYRD